jgi:hypothetical protein
MRACRLIPPCADRWKSGSQMVAVGFDVMSNRDAASGTHYFAFATDWLAAAPPARVARLAQAIAPNWY